MAQIAAVHRIKLCPKFTRELILHLSKLHEVSQFSVYRWFRIGDPRIYGMMPAKRRSKYRSGSSYDKAEYDKAYRKANRERIRQNRRDYLRTYSKAYREKRADYFRAYRARYKAINPLRDNYYRNLLAKRLSVHPTCITEELLSFYKMHLNLKRAKKEIQ